jgi:hypothetical protein
MANEKRLPAPLVLAASSGMVAIGLAAFWAIDVPNEVGLEEQAQQQYAALTIDDRTPERVAQSYLDAWRRRQWDQAAGISIGAARTAALEKQAMDLDVEHEDRVMAREVWERLSSAPLEVEFTGSERLDQAGGLYLHGIASYEFMGAPYRREIGWVVRPEGTLFRVERMENGTVLTAVPRMLEGSEL